MVVGHVTGDAGPFVRDLEYRVGEANVDRRRGAGLLGGAEGAVDQLPEGKLGPLIGRVADLRRELTPGREVRRAARAVDLARDERAHRPPPATARRPAGGFRPRYAPTGTRSGARPG